MDNEDFISGWNNVASMAGVIANTHGFWEGNTYNDAHKSMKIALMHSELSEALEAIRHGNPPSEKISNFSNLEEELADLIIRVADFGRYYNLNLARAVTEKMKYNESREYKHGKAF